MKFEIYTQLESLFMLMTIYLLSANSSFLCSAAQPAHLFKCSSFIIVTTQQFISINHLSLTSTRVHHVWIRISFVFSCVLRDTTPRFVRRLVGRSVGRSVGWSVGSHFTFFLCFCGLWPHCTCPSALVTQILPLPTRTRLR